jgi:hypothetical protein
MKRNFRAKGTWPKHQRKESVRIKLCTKEESFRTESLPPKRENSTIQNSGQEDRQQGETEYHKDTFERRSEEGYKDIVEGLQIFVFDTLSDIKQVQQVTVASFISNLYKATNLFLILWAILLIRITRMSSENLSGSPRKHQREESRSIQSVQQQLESFSITRDIPPPRTPSKSMRDVPTMDSSYGESTETGGAEGPSAGGQTGSQHQGTVNDDRMMAAFKMMAETLEAVRSQSPSILMPQLPPYPNENLPLFDGTDVTNFLERYEDMAKYHNFTDKMKVDRLLVYCKTKQRAIIEASEEYSEATFSTDWTTLRTELRRRFRNADKYQREERLEYFEHWLHQCQKRSNLNIREYLQEFQIRSRRCIEAGTIEENRRGYYLLKGLPLKQATRILEKFGLRTDNPTKFEYKKLQNYLSNRLEVEEEAKMLNPEEAIKSFEPDVEFKVDQRTENQSKVTTGNYREQQQQTSGFKPATLNYPLKGNKAGDSRTQSPPGAVATKSEVDGLVEKMVQLKLNRVMYQESPWKVQFNAREEELMDNPVIQAEVRRQTESRSEALRPYMPYDPNQGNGYQNQIYQGQSFNQGNGNQIYGTQGFSNNNQGYQGGPNSQRPPNFGCWVCDQSGHRKSDCPTLRAYMEYGWVHLDERGQLQWGTPEQPQGKVVGLGTSGWATNISAQIKTRFLKRDADPLKTKAEWMGGPPTVAPSGISSISIQLEPDHTGLLSDDNYARYWRMSDNLANEEGTLVTRMAQCNNTVAAAVISRGESARSNKTVQGPFRIEKPPPKTFQTPTNTERIPHLKGHKSRDQEFFTGTRNARDTQVHFDPSTNLRGDVEMGEATEYTAEGLSKSTDKLENREKHPKKLRLAQKLEADPHNVVQRVLDTQVQIPLKTLIGNMPEVKKRLFQASYTSEEFDGLSVASLQHIDNGDHEEDSENERPRMSAGVSSLSVVMPNYVLVEAEQGVIKECMTIRAEHWSDPAICQIEASIHGEAEPGIELEPDQEFRELTHNRREYDRAAGVEHLRRECPKVPIDIRGTQFLSLLDSGAELNTIQRCTAEKAMLPITSMPKNMRTAKMVAANGSVEGFSGMVWGVPITIGRIEIRTNFFVLEHCTNPIILGNPFLTDSRARIEYATNGLTYCRIYSEDGENSTRFVCTRGNRLHAPGLYAGPLVGNARGV